jgi:parallel beta-helix repeat protein
MKFSYYIPMILAASAIYSHSALSSSLRAFDTLKQQGVNNEQVAGQEVSQPSGKALYVNQSGNDAFNGSLKTPFKSLEEALKKIKAGETLYLSGGVHKLNSPQTLSTNGTESEKITVKALDKSQPVILDASGLPESDAAALTIDASHVNLEDMHVMGANADAINVKGSDVALRNNVVADSKEAGIRVSGGENKNITLEGNEVKKSGSKEGAVVVEDANDVTLKNNHIYDNEAGILLSGTDTATVEQNILNDNKQGHVFLENSDTAMIEKNEFFTSESGTPAPAIVASEDNSDITVSNNVMENVSSALMQKKDGGGKSGAMTNSVFDQNTMFGVTGDVAQTASPASGANNITFSNNIIKNNDEGKAKPVQGVTFNNNCTDSAGQQPSSGGNVPADISLKDGRQPASAQGNVVSASSKCEQSNAGATDFEPIEFVDSTVTLAEDEDTEVASAGDTQPALDDTKVSLASDVAEDEPTANTPDSQTVTSASDEDGEAPTNAGNSGAPKNPLTPEKSPFSVAGGMDNASIAQMIQQLVSEIVSGIMNSIFGGSNPTAFAGNTANPMQSGEGAGNAPQQNLAQNALQQGNSQQSSQSSASDSTDPSGSTPSGEQAGSAPSGGAAPQQQQSSAPKSLASNGSVMGEAPSRGASNATQTSPSGGGGGTAPVTSQLASTQSIPTSGVSLASADNTTDPTAASDEDAAENNGVTAAPVEETVNDVENAQDGDMTESDIFIPSAGEGAITNDFTCEIDWASKEASAEAEPLEDCKVNEYRTEPKTGDMSSPSWASGDFSGKHCRKLSSDGTKLEVDMEFDGGGFDTSILSGSEESGAINHLVDDVPAGLKITNSFSMQMQGEGFEWFVIGPKVGIWPCQKEEDCPATFWPEWNENYIVEYSSRTPQEEDERLRKDGGEYLGETTHEGSTYKHYRTPFSDWTQYWSIRQDYRLAGTVTIKHFLDVWRKAGMPNTYVQKIQANFESGGKGCAKLTIEDVLISKVN